MDSHFAVARPFLGIVVGPVGRGFAEPRHSFASCFTAAASTMFAFIVGFSPIPAPFVAVVQACFYDQPKESMSSHCRADPSLDRPGLAVATRFPGR